MTTVKDILNLIDKTRKSQEIVQIMFGSTDNRTVFGSPENRTEPSVEAAAMVRSCVWDCIEHKEVSRIRADMGRIQIWLADDYDEDE